MYIICMNCHVLFELIENLALKVGLSPGPIQIQACLCQVSPRLPMWGWDDHPNCGTEK